MDPWLAYLLLAAAGFAAAVINVIAGGGSFLTLPILIFLGLPAVEANGTNRVGILAQNVSAVWGFHRSGVMEWRWALWTVLPVTIGAGIGAWIALRVPDRDFRRILAFLMVAMTLATFFAPGRAAPDAERRHRPARPWLVTAGFFVVGLYGGFVQAGVGFLILAVTTLAGLDLVRGNAVKVAAVLVMTLLPIALFASEGKIRWPEGAALSVGSLAGSLVGVSLSLTKGEKWLRAFVTVTVVVFAVRLWFS